MAWAYRASSLFSATGVYNGGAGSDSLTAALGAALTLGDRIIVSTVVYPTTGTATPSAPTVTDNLNAGNYTEDQFATWIDGTTRVRASVFSHANSAAGTPTVRVQSVSTNQGGIMGAAYSGLLTTDPGADVSTQATGTGGTATGTNTAATGAANELVVGIYVDDGWGNVSSTNPVGWTQRGSIVTSTLANFIFADQDSGASGATPHYVLNSGTPGGSVTWAMFTVVYRLAGAVTVVPPPRPLLDIIDRRRIVLARGL